MSLNSLEFRKAMGCFGTGVTIITVDLEGEVHGMTANAFASVSLDPPLVLVCVDHDTRTHTHLHTKKRFGINVLCEDQRAISEYYARAERTHEKAAAEAGAVLIAPNKGLRCCMGRWRTLSANSTRRKWPGIIPSLLRKWRTWWCGRASRCCSSGENIEGWVRKLGSREP